MFPLYLRLSATNVIFVVICLLHGADTKLLADMAELKEGQCVWYGRCAWNDDRDSYYNCVYDGPAKLLNNQTHIDILLDLCPEQINSKGEAYTCCDGEQLTDLYSSSFRTFGYQMLSKCPSCWHNFRKYFCALICGSEQSLYMYPSEVKDLPVEHKPDNTAKSIIKLDSFVSQELADGFYESCKDVTAAGTNVMDLLCGQSATTCTSGALLVFLGDNPLAPFIITVHVTSEDTVQAHKRTFKPLALPTTACNMPAEIDGPTCACSDCQLACRRGEFEDSCIRHDVDTVTLLGMDSFVLLAIVMYIVLAGLFLLSVIIIHFRRKRRNAQPRRERLTDSNAPDTSKESLPLQEPSSAATEEVNSDPPASPTHGEASYSHSSESNATTHRLPHIRNIIFAASNYYASFSYKFEDKVELSFFQWGRWCAKHPAIVLSLGLFLTVTLSLGLLFFEVETDPVSLWTTPTSRGRLEMAYFESHFAPMQRIEQIIVVPSKPRRYKLKEEIIGPVFSWEFLMEVMKLQRSIEGITGNYDDETVRFSDICYQPLLPDNNECVIVGIFNYFQNDYDRIANMSDSDFAEHVKECAANPMNINCFAKYGGPVMPFLAFGGFEDKNYMESTALAITFVADNYYDENEQLKPMAWEEQFLNFMRSYKSDHLEVYYLSTRSIHDQLIEESHADISTVLFSYIIMFCYIAIGLGQVHNCRGLLVDSKITLGFCGTVIVTLSVLSSIGIFGFLKVPATLIVLEVVPFMVLAVGVDNIFILVQAYQRDVRLPNETRESQVGRVVGDVAPSMLLSSITDALGFFLGALSSMPAVRTFGLYAGTACCIAFLLQISCFVSLLTLDAKRQEDYRLDVCCCIRGRKQDAFDPERGLMYRFVKNIYSPILLKTPVRIVVVLTFLAWLCSSVAVVNKIDVGLETELTMSKDSSLFAYFKNLKRYLKIGPPVHFVVQDNVNYSKAEVQVMMCDGAGCVANSMLAQLAYAAEHPDSTYIRQSPQSWLDDYHAWMRSDCCQQQVSTQEFCPSKDKTTKCKKCKYKTEIKNSVRRVVGPDFVKYLQYFLQDNPTKDGCIGGHASYSDAVEIKEDGKVGATYFTAYHTVLKTSKDYYEALMSARCIADQLTKLMNTNLPPSTDGEPYKVFPYCQYYVFYEQYLTMWSDTLLNLTYSSITIFLMAFLILGLNLHLSVIIVFTVVVIVTNLLGAMYWWDIQLNAIALVNLVVAVGIAVEFCSHISRAFAASVEDTKLLRTREALVTMGSSVLSGITLTKFSGIVVLAFARSPLFQIYYFRINLCIVLFGAAHGLIFLPVLLSFFGPSISKNKLLRRQQQLAQRQLQEQEIQS